MRHVLTRPIFGDQIEIALDRVHHERFAVVDRVGILHVQRFCAAEIHCPSVRSRVDNRLGEPIDSDG